MWVRSEYAGELAVLSAWLCALLPWGVSYAGGIRLFRIHFIYAFLQFTPGLALEGSTPYVSVWAARTFPQDEALAFGYRLWLLAAGVFSLALALSVVYYVYDHRLEERAPVDPVRLMGVLLLASAVAFTASTYFVLTRLPGWTIPVGVGFMYVFGALLLVVERTEAEIDAAETRTDRPEPSDVE